jgi:stage III sporulation protein AD
METYWKALGGLLIAVVLGLVLGKDMSVLLSLAICAMVTAVATHYLQPVLAAIKQMAQAANFQGENFQVLIKILGISLVSEISGMICADAGAGSISKVLKILTSSVILWISMPVFQSVLSLLQQIMREL